MRVLSNNFKQWLEIHFGDVLIVVGLSLIALWGIDLIVH